MVAAVVVVVDAFSIEAINVGTALMAAVSHPSRVGLPSMPAPPRGWISKWTWGPVASPLAPT
jgi:hypothetical protein